MKDKEYYTVDEAVDIGGLCGDYFRSLHTAQILKDSNLHVGCCGFFEICN